MACWISWTEIGARDFEREVLPKFQPRDIQEIFDPRTHPHRGGVDLLESAHQQLAFR
jgi:hypothetical protein